MVKHKNDDKRGRFYIEDNSQSIALMEYVYAGTDKFIIEHTEVDTAFEGKGLGRKLVASAVEYARANNLKIIPLCPYANAVFSKDPDSYKDVWFGK